MLTLTSSPAHQKRVHELITPSLNNYYKTSYYLPHVGTHGFEGMTHSTVSPFAWQSNEAILSTSPRTLSLRFDLALVYREAELSTSNIMI